MTLEEYIEDIEEKHERNKETITLFAEEPEDVDDEDIENMDDEEMPKELRKYLDLRDPIIYSDIPYERPDHFSDLYDLVEDEDCRIEDFSDLYIPIVNDPSDHSRPERCKYLLRRLQDAGHPGNMNQAEIARVFDVIPATINRDMRQRILPLMKEGVGEDHLTISNTLFQTAMANLAEEGDMMKAIRTLEKWNDWLENRAIVDKEPEKVEKTTKYEVDEETEELIDNMF